MKIEFREVPDFEESDFEVGDYRRKATAPNCPACGRFCRMTTYQRYNGTWNIWYADVDCKNCGKFTEPLT